MNLRRGDEWDLDRDGMCNESCITMPMYQVKDTSRTDVCYSLDKMLVQWWDFSCR